MVRKHLLYSLTCDCCKRVFVSEDYMCDDKENILAQAEVAEWRKINGKIYCPECYEVDENDEYCRRKESGYSH